MDGRKAVEIGKSGGGGRDRCASVGNMEDLVKRKREGGMSKEREEEDIFFVGSVERQRDRRRQKKRRKERRSEKVERGDGRDNEGMERRGQENYGVNDGED